tara:strand:+ start:9939 stop:10805 length:867 start_codon:yes stop_codon:yes gene_type:complete
MRKISNILTRPGVDEGIWEDIEELLISSDLGSLLTNILIDRIKIKCAQFDKPEVSVVFDMLKQEIVEIIGPGRDIVPDNFGSHPKRPLVVLVVGVNGVGKTTSVAKMAQYFKDSGKTVIIAASDTYRAAAIEQILSWGNKIDVDVISHVMGGDPAAVAFDAVEAGKARGVDIVLVDTAGRLHTKSNLMDEVKKIKRVISKVDEDAPHEVILVMDACTGQNGLVQAKSFVETVDCTGVFLAKLDGTSKGGIVVPIIHDLSIPVLFVGTGESISDIAPFSSNEFVQDLFS